MRQVSIFFLIMFALSACSGGAKPGTTGPSTNTPVAQGPLMTSPDYSVQVFLWGNPQTSDRDLKLVKDAGFRWIKQMFQWNFVEGKGKGKFEWDEPDRIVALAQKYDLKILARMDVAPDWARGAGADMGLHGPPTKMQDYGDYVGAVAERYKGRIQAYQIWNEPNLAREWNGKAPSAAEFTEMLKVAYTAIKKADPNAIVIPGGMSPTTAPLPLAVPDTDFIKDMYKAGASQYFDMLGVHAAGYLSPPEADPAAVAVDPKASNNDKSGPDKNRSYAFRHAEDIRKIMVDNGDEKKRMAILEFGWTTDDRKGSSYAWFHVTEDQKAKYLVGAYQWAEQNWKPWIAVMSVIYMCDPNWRQDHDEQYYWCITDESGDPWPAYTALKDMKKVTN
jgi:hypothetical protein